jgi:hypothetical protein
MLLICSAPCESGLKDQETEPVQIHCKQLHSHTSYNFTISLIDVYKCLIYAAIQ